MLVFSSATTAFAAAVEEFLSLLAENYQVFLTIIASSSCNETATTRKFLRLLIVIILVRTRRDRVLFVVFFGGLSLRDVKVTIIAPLEPIDYGLHACPTAQLVVVAA